MRILFIKEPFKYEHLGVMYLSAVLKEAGHITQLHRTDESISEVFDFKPDFIFYSIMTGSHNNLLKYNRLLKRHIKFTSVFGGPHCTYFPKFAKEKDVDYVIRGEAELDILKVLKKPKRKVILSKLPEELDRLPFPDRELFYRYPEQKNNPIKHFISSRGCPFDCAYCYNHVFAKLYKNSMRVRYRSPKNVINEIKEVMFNDPTRFIYFQDDCFIINQNWLNKFLDLYKKSIKFPFHCLVRLDLLNEDIVKQLADSGCKCIRCAVESGNEHIRNKILKRNMTEEQIIEGTRLLKKYDIKFVLQNMLGLPETTLKEDLETLRLSIKCRPTLGWSSLFQPYPMTELGKDYIKDIDSFNPSFYDNTILDLPHKKEVKRLQKLFGFITRYPIFYPLVHLLIRIPLDKLYKKIWLWNNKKSDKELYGGII